MANVLKWKLRGPADAVLIYRDTVPFDRNSLPSPVHAVLAGDANTYEDSAVTAGTLYFYMVATQAGSPAEYRYSALSSALSSALATESGSVPAVPVTTTETVLYNQNMPDLSPLIGTIPTITGIDAYDEIVITTTFLTISAAQYCAMRLSPNGGSPARDQAGDYYRGWMHRTNDGLATTETGYLIGDDEGGLDFAVHRIRGHNDANVYTSIQSFAMMDNTGEHVMQFGIIPYFEVQDTLDIYANAGVFSQGRITVTGVNYE